MPSPDHAITTDVRQVLARHWVDRRRVQFVVSKGTVHLTGELHRSDWAPRQPDAWAVAELERDIGDVEGVHDVLFDLGNWVRESRGGWRSPYQP